MRNASGRMRSAECFLLSICWDRKLGRPENGRPYELILLFGFDFSLLLLGLGEVVQVGSVQVGYSPECHAVSCPVDHIVALTGHRFITCLGIGVRRPDVQVDGMKAAAVDEYRDRSAIYIVQASTLQIESRVGQVRHRRREVELPVEPWLDGMPIIALDIDQMTLERADVAGHDVAGHQSSAGRSAPDQRDRQHYDQDGHYGCFRDRPSPGP